MRASELHWPRGWKSHVWGTGTYWRAQTQQKRTPSEEAVAFIGGPSRDTCEEAMNDLPVLCAMTRLWEKHEHRRLMRLRVRRKKT